MLITEQDREELERLLKRDEETKARRKIEDLQRGGLLAIKKRDHHHHRISEKTPFRKILTTLIIGQVGSWNQQQPT